LEKRQREKLNYFFVHIFNQILSWEESSFKEMGLSDLSLRELHVIEAVSSLEGSGKNSMAEVARYLKLSPASLTTAVNVLVKKQYLEREYSPNDRRVIFVRLTPKGVEANVRYLGFVKDMIREVGDDLDEQTADRMIEFIYKLSEYLEDRSNAMAKISWDD